MVWKLPAYMTEILLGKSVKWNKQTNYQKHHVCYYQVWISQCFKSFLLKTIILHRFKNWIFHWRRLNKTTSNTMSMRCLKGITPHWQNIDRNVKLPLTPNIHVECAMVYICKCHEIISQVLKSKKMIAIVLHIFQDANKNIAF
jgi:hypothetical protein